jgi:trk system potassium uptake protein TrkA
MSMNIIIIGCGRQGAELAKSLGVKGFDVTVVDNDQTAFERLGSSFGGKVILGDGIDRDTLIQGGIEKADGLAAVTASDEINIVVARLARQVFRVPRVVARVHDPLKAEIYQRLGLMTVTPAMLGTQRFRELLTFSHLEPTKRLGDGEVSIIEIDAPPALAGRGIHELVIPGEIEVIAITRDNKTDIPIPGAVFHDKDILHLAVASRSINRLKELLGGGI